MVDDLIEVTAIPPEPEGEPGATALAGELASDWQITGWEKGAAALTFSRSETGSAPRARGKGGARKKGAGPEVVDAEVVD